MKKLVLRVFGLAGTIIFAPIFGLTFTDPAYIEKAGASFIEWKVEQNTYKAVDSITLPNENAFDKLLGMKAMEIRLEKEKEIEAIKKQLRDDLPAILAKEISKMRNLDCECRKKWEKEIRNNMLYEITALESAKERVKKYSQVKYMEVVHKLTQDIRIFLAVNLSVFIILLLVSILKAKAIDHLFLPGFLLLISTVVCSYFYIFEQNWFYTIIYNSYTGYAYLAYLVVVFLFLCDIIFNKGRVTTKIINFLSNAIGNTASVVPC